MLMWRFIVKNWFSEKSGENDFPPWILNSVCSQGEQFGNIKYFVSEKKKVGTLLGPSKSSS